MRKKLWVRTVSLFCVIGIINIYCVYLKISDTFNKYDNQKFFLHSSLWLPEFVFKFSIPEIWAAVLLLPPLHLLLNYKEISDEIHYSVYCMHCKDKTCRFSTSKNLSLYSRSLWYLKVTLTFISRGRNVEEWRGRGNTTGSDILRICWKWGNILRTWAAREQQKIPKFALNTNK